MENLSHLQSGADSRSQHVKLQHSVHLSSAMPIKKRRFPVIRLPSPTPEEKHSSFNASGSKNEQESNWDGGLSASDAKDSDLVGNSDVRTSPFILKRVEVALANEEFRRANVSVLQGTKSHISLGSSDDLRNTMNILSNEKLIVPGVLERCNGVPAMNLKQENDSEQAKGAHRGALLTSPMNIELSLGPKETTASSMECQKSEAVDVKPRIFDPSLLSLGSTKEKLVLRDNRSDGNLSSQGSANQSNWDLNTTVDGWEGFTDNGGSVPRPVDIHGFGKSDGCSDVISSLTATSTVGFGLDKDKHVSAEPYRQCQTDDSLGLRLAMPDTELDAGRNHSSLMDKLTSSYGSRHLNPQQVKLSSVNTNTTVKLEPVDENANRDCSIGSGSSSNVILSNCSSITRELVDSVSLNTALQSSASPDKLDEHRSIKFEAVEGSREGSKLDDAILPWTVARVIQHQESCASSSALPAPLMPQDSCASRLPTCSELTTSGDLLNQSQHSFRSRVFHDHKDNLDPASQDDKHSNVCNVGNFSLEYPHESSLPQVDECAHELCHSCDVSADDKVSISTEIFEEDSFGSDCEPKGYPDIETPKAVGENTGVKDDKEIEDEEVPECLRDSSGKDPNVDGKKTEDLEHVNCGSQNLQSSVSLGDQSINAPDIKEKMTAKENHDNIHNDISYLPHSEDKTLQNLSDKVLEVTVNQKRYINVPPHKWPDVLGVEDVGKDPAKRVSRDRLTNRSSAIDNDLGNKATNKVCKEICSRGSDLTLSKVEASSKCFDAAKDSDGVGNKSRIIKLSRTAAVKSPGKSRSIANGVLMPRSGKGRYSDLDGEIQLQVNRHTFYTDGSKKFAKDRVHDRFIKNPRQSFMLGKARVSGRFDLVHGEWDSGHDFTPETCNGPPDYRPMSRRHTSNISDIELECNGYGIEQDGTALVSSRRKTINNEFRLVHHTSRRLSPGDRDGNITRSFPMMCRLPRNVSPSRSTIEDGSNMIGLRHGDKFMPQLADNNIFDPNCNRPQVIYDDLNGLLMPGNRDFSTPHRKGYRGIHSKSPVRSCTRSPRPRRRSPNVPPPDLTQHRSMGLHRMGRTRSPDEARFHDEIVARRQEFPSYIGRHPNNLREVDSGPQHIHYRSVNSDRRGSPSQVFSRHLRSEALDSQDMGYGDEYIDGQLASNKFHELRNDGNFDGRRNFAARWGPLRPFHPNYISDNENFHFHGDGAPRPYRFCPDVDTEFVDSINMEEREFDRRIKHPPVILPRRVKNFEEQEEVSYRPAKQAWHDDGFTKARAKRRRY